MMSRYAIEVDDATKRFGRTEVLHGITMNVRQGEIMGLVGPSGCGKTTLVDMMMGLSVPTSGAVLLDGEPAPFPTARKALGCMPQETALYEDITADENMAFFGALYGLKGTQLADRKKQALAAAHLDNGSRKTVSSFSGGMKRRLSLAVALLCAPKILVMDEPTVGLDPVHRAALWSEFHTLAKSGSALLVTTHIMDEATRCDRVAMMRDGRIICCDKPEEIIEETGCASLEDAFILLASGKKEAHHA
jgi:ABC-2 type transport system ATP-binding protein